MTVTDRQARARTTRPSAPIAPELDALLATAGRRGGRRPLLTTTQPIAALDAIDLFAAARAQDLEATLWLQPAADRSIVGIGRAWATEPEGPDRFTVATEAWRTVLADAIVTGRTSDHGEAGPTLLGGLGFSGRPPDAADPWAPFGAASLVLPSFGIAQRGLTSSLTVAIGPDGSDDVDPADVERWWQALRQDAADRARHDDDHRPIQPAGLEIVAERPDRTDWERTVGLFAGAVGRGRIDKVVLARRVVARAAADFDVVAALRHLAASAPESTTFAFARGGTTFLGATPERLVRTVGRSFETVAIAGSAARGRDPDDDARLAAGLLASEKDREEHAVVVDTLRANLAPIVESLHVAEAPAILPLRHLQHLVTPITGTLRDEAGLLSLGGQLHPTPAVGGAPREVALDLIAEHEGFDRGWYAGPIGWLGADGDGELMVALRCGLVAGREATLFAGCGIVADSDPAREWDESRLKLRTMATALGGLTGDDR
jgi:isochorismate synthase